MAKQITLEEAHSMARSRNIWLIGCVISKDDIGLFSPIGEDQFASNGLVINHLGKVLRFETEWEDSREWID